jgi:5-methylcytosine-specific restriction endonuclease McrA
MKRYCLDNCGRLTDQTRCARCRRRRAALSFYGTPAWRRLRRLALARDGARCVLPGCSSPRDRPTVHHVKAREDGGRDHLSNLLTLCHGHHVAYEGDRRAGRTTELVELVERTAEQVLGTTTE